MPKPRKVQKKNVSLPQRITQNGKMETMWVGLLQFDSRDEKLQLIDRVMLRISLSIHHSGMIDISALSIQKHQSSHRV